MRTGNSSGPESSHLSRKFGSGPTRPSALTSHSIRMITTTTFRTDLIGAAMGM